MPSHDDAPPAYYVQPDIANFDFMPPVEAFLREIDEGPRALCRIDIIRNFEFSSWKMSFIEVGLLETNAATLEQLFLDSLTSEQGFILLAAIDSVPHAGAHTRTAPATATSVSTESTLTGDD